MGGGGTPNILNDTTVFGVPEAYGVIIIIIIPIKVIE